MDATNVVASPIATHYAADADARIAAAWTFSSALDVPTASVPVSAAAVSVAVASGVAPPDVAAAGPSFSRFHVADRTVLDHAALAPNVPAAVFSPVPTVTTHVFVNVQNATDLAASRDASALETYLSINSTLLALLAYDDHSLNCNIMFCFSLLFFYCK